MELSVYKIDGSESGKKVVLNEEIFGIQPNDHAIYLDVKQYLANQRQGTAKSKDRSEVDSMVVRCNTENLFIESYCLSDSSVDFVN